uniref:Cysteine rich secreted protein n=1 Tax=Riptortus pedestris TaxID=329032 RepID=R4WCS6_RIPPE|nr:cysteine rich secreted protein [Riptortus pedestris]
MQKGLITAVFCSLGVIFFLKGSSSIDICSPITICPDGQHCCSATSCCEDQFECCEEGESCCSPTTNQVRPKTSVIFLTKPLEGNPLDDEYLEAIMKHFPSKFILPNTTEYIEEPSILV